MRLNVGFLLNKNVGYSRNVAFDHPTLTIGDDLEVRDLTGTLRLTRTQQGVYAHGQLQATTELECARCLSSFSKSLTTEIEELFPLHNAPNQEGDYAVQENGVLDLNPLVRESLMLDVPIKLLCRVDCQGLCTICGENLNETQCDHPEQEIDPRLEVLKTLLPGPD